MSDYRLHCFGEAANSYKAALMPDDRLRLDAAVGASFFQGATRSGTMARTINAMGEGRQGSDPRLARPDPVRRDPRLSGRADRPVRRRRRRRSEILRWILFDNHKFTSYFATLRFMLGIKRCQEPGDRFLRGRVIDAWKVVEKQLEVTDWLVGGRPTIADFSLAGYVFYDEVGFDPWTMFPAIDAWRQRLAALPGSGRVRGS